MKQTQERKEYMKAYRLANKAKLKESGKVYREANQEKLTNYRNVNKKYMKEYYDVNKDKLTAKMKEYRIINSDKKKVIDKNYRDANKEAIKEYNKLYREVNKDKINESLRMKIKTNSLFKLKRDTYKLIDRTFRVKWMNKCNKTILILGCSFDDFKIYLESKFESWMNWDNRGLYNGELNYGWDIDHIIPLSTAITVEDVIKLNHFSNLQPLCGYTNRYIKKDII